MQEESTCSVSTVNQILGLSRLTEKSVNRGSNSFSSVRFVFSGFRFGLVYVLQYPNLFATRAMIGSLFSLTTF